MYLHSFLCGIAVTLAVNTVALLIAEAVLRKKIRRMKQKLRFTNGDRIRAMTDAELAVFLNRTTVCDACVFGDICREPYNMEKCNAGVETWLAMTVEEEENEADTV